MVLKAATASFSRFARSALFCSTRLAALQAAYFSAYLRATSSSAGFCTADLLSTNRVASFSFGNL